MDVQTRAKVGATSLAQYADRGSYQPRIGDFLVWSGWLSTSYGVVDGISSSGDVLHAIFEGLPVLLFTIAPDQRDRHRKDIKVSDIRESRPGSWAILQHDHQHNSQVWYV